MLVILFSCLSSLDPSCCKKCQKKVPTMAFKIVSRQALKNAIYCHLKELFLYYTVNINMQDPISAKGISYVTLTTGNSFSVYLKFLQNLYVNYLLQVIYIQRLKEFKVNAKGTTSSESYIGNPFSAYRILHIYIYSVCKQDQQICSHCVMLMVSSFSLGSFRRSNKKIF